MIKSITQEFDYGCGIACFAFALDISYKEATIILGPKQSLSNRFWVKDLRTALNNSGLKLILLDISTIGYESQFIKTEQ